MCVYNTVQLQNNRETDFTFATVVSSIRPVPMW